jgi:hypothetical protein
MRATQAGVSLAANCRIAVPLFYLTNELGRPITLALRPLMRPDRCLNTLLKKENSSLF